MAQTRPHFPSRFLDLALFSGTSLVAAQTWGRKSRTSPLNTSGLVRTYSYISGMGGSASARSGRLTLNAGGTYTLSCPRFGGFSSASVSVSNTNNSAESSKWAFDPDSYTLTFSPQGGRPYAVPAFKRGQNECTDSGCTWMIAGQEWKK